MTASMCWTLRYAFAIEPARICGAIEIEDMSILVIVAGKRLAEQAEGQNRGFKGLVCCGHR